jgi:hypothetical protein
MLDLLWKDWRMIMLDQLMLDYQPGHLLLHNPGQPPQPVATHHIRWFDALGNQR